MEVSLFKADLKDAVTIHEMKVTAFMPLLEKYQDFIIHHLEVAVGGIRVVK
ncbi:hypothetical protein [Paenibacillus polymyxa]|uniref:hypothetical protein n=1 Tax=Paenibacillus polymyxa TaxID=1406 RepID=UPI0020352434|nr:hypothetical protein [Paenibacillus polymyxa]